MVDAKVKAALMAPDAFADFGSKLLKDRPLLADVIGTTDGRLSEVCLGARVDQGVADSRMRTWTGYLVVQQEVYGLVDVPAAYVLDSVRAKARSCQTYVATINEPSRTVKADAVLPELTGVDGTYAFCESVPDVSARNWSCEAFLARGDLVVKVVVSAGAETPTRDFLPKVLPRAAESLLKAG